MSRAAQPRPQPAATRPMRGDQVGGAARSGARGEFGELIPVRPATSKPAVTCSTLTSTTCSRPTAIATGCTPRCARCTGRWKPAIGPSGVSPNGPTSMSRAGERSTRRSAKDWSSLSAHRRRRHGPARWTCISMAAESPRRRPASGERRVVVAANSVPAAGKETAPAMIRREPLRRDTRRGGCACRPRHEGARKEPSWSCTAAIENILVR